MKRAEAEKIKDELKKMFYSIVEFMEMKVADFWFDKWFDDTYPPELEYIPFEYTDFNDFMLKKVRRKGEAFNGEKWQIVGLDQHEVIINYWTHLNCYLYTSMFEEWEFVDGTPFGKIKK